MTGMKGKGEGEERRGEERRGMERNGKEIVKVCSLRFRASTREGPRRGRVVPS